MVGGAGQTGARSATLGFRSRQLVDLSENLAGTAPRTYGALPVIATVVTAKHRVFQFLDAGILADDALIAIAQDDGFTLGVLSSQLHIEWAEPPGALSKIVLAYINRLLRNLPLPRRRHRPNPTAAQAHRPARRADRRAPQAGAGRRAPGLDADRPVQRAGRTARRPADGQKKKPSTPRAWWRCCVSCTTSWTRPCSPPTA